MIHGIGVNLRVLVLGSVSMNDVAASDLPDDTPVVERTIFAGFLIANMPTLGK